MVEREGWSDGDIFRCLRGGSSDDGRGLSADRELEDILSKGLV